LRVCFWQNWWWMTKSVTLASSGYWRGALSI